MSDTMVRMGELAASKTAGDMLVTLGLGSCIGLVLMDRRMGVAGLAHVVLPDSGGHTEVNKYKFADHAVPELIKRVCALGARRPMLEAVMVGGASMFSFGGNGLEVGQRNEAAVREELAKLRVPVIASETGGAKGRTVRVHVETGLVTSKAAGETELELYPATLAKVAA
jgi:chemotaxis protein CheD